MKEKRPLRTSTEFAEKSAKKFWAKAKIDDLVKNQLFTRSHKGTKKGMLKTVRFFFVASVIFV